MLTVGENKWFKEMVRALEERQETSSFGFFHSFTLLQLHLCLIENQVMSIVQKIPSQIQPLFDTLPLPAVTYNHFYPRSLHQFPTWSPCLPLYSLQSIFHT